MMLFVAAILEGEFRQLVASTPWRFVIAAASAVGWPSMPSAYCWKAAGTDAP